MASQGSSNRQRALDEEKLRCRSDIQALKIAEDQRTIEEAGREPRAARAAAMANKAWMADASTGRQKKAGLRDEDNIPSEGGQTVKKSVHGRGARQREDDDDGSEEEPARKKPKRGLKAQQTTHNKKQSSAHPKKKRKKTPEFLSNSEDEDPFRVIGNGKQRNATSDLEDFEVGDAADEEYGSDEDEEDESTEESEEADEEDHGVEDSDGELRQPKGKKKAHTAAHDLFNIDDEDVQTVRRSGTATLIEDGHEPESSDDVATVTPLPPAKAKRALRKDQVGGKALEQECAVVVRSTTTAKPLPKSRNTRNSRCPTNSSPSSPTTPTDGDDGDDDSDITVIPTANEAKWNLNARLQPGKIKTQNPCLRTVIRESIKFAEIKMLTERPWLELYQAGAYKQEVLREGVKRSMSQNPSIYKKIEERINCDNDFNGLVGTWVLDRLANHRNKVYSTAAKEGLQPFRLGTGPDCAERVGTILEDHLYVYPGSWGSVEVARTPEYPGEGPTREKPIWIPDRFVKVGTKKRLQTYLHESIAQCITAGFFQSSKAWGFKHKSVFTSSDKQNPQELELPIAVVAFGATALFAAISRWREGKAPSKPERFIGDVYTQIYDCHVKALQKILDDAPNNYHFIMHALYKATTSLGRSNNIDAGKNELGPLAGVDMTGLD